MDQIKIEILQNLSQIRKGCKVVEARIITDDYDDENNVTNFLSDINRCKVVGTEIVDDKNNSKETGK